MTIQKTRVKKEKTFRVAYSTTSGLGSNIKLNEKRGWQGNSQVLHTLLFAVVLLNKALLLDDTLPDMCTNFSFPSPHRVSFVFLRIS